MAPNEDELYQEHILDHYEDPYHRGKCQTCTHTHEDTNPLCGDVIRMELQIDDRGAMKEVYFNGNGCCISQAAASMLAEKFDGKTIEEVKRFTAKDMLDLFGAADAEPAKVLLAFLAGVAGGNLFAAGGRRWE